MLAGTVLLAAPVHPDWHDGSQAYAMGSESELLRRLAGKGASACYVAEAGVRHMITEEQMTYDAVMRRAKRHGAGFVQMRRDQNISADYAGAPRWIWRGWASEALRLACARLLGWSQEAAKAHFQMAWFGGAIERSRTLNAAHAGANAVADYAARDEALGREA